MQAPLPGMQQTANMSVQGLFNGPPTMQPAQMPQMQAPPMAQPQQPQQSILGRINDTIGGLFDAGRPQAPTGYDGLLSDKEIARERPSWFQSHFRATPESADDMYRNRLDRVLATKQAVNSIKQNQDMLTRRASIMQKYAPQPGDTQAQSEQRMRGAIPELMQSGDFPLLKSIDSMMPNLFKAPAEEKPFQHMDVGDHVNVMSRDGMHVLATYAKGKVPPSQEALAQMQANADYKAQGLNLRTDAANERNAARMSSQYLNVTTRYKQTHDAMQAINEAKPGALRGDPIAQQTLLQDFVKLNLPGQIVTVGELHNYANLMGLGDKGQQIMQRLATGAPLAQSQVKLIIDHANALMVERRKAAKYVRDQYIARGKEHGVGEENFLDHFGDLDEPTNAPSSSGVTKFLPKAP